MEYETINMTIDDFHNIINTELNRDFDSGQVELHQFYTLDINNKELMESINILNKLLRYNLDFQLRKKYNSGIDLLLI